MASPATSNIVCASPARAQPRVEFPAAAIDAVYQASRGTPRLINLICDRALHRGYSARVGRIEPHFVWDAITDLGLAIARPEPAAPQRVEPAKAEPPKADAPGTAPVPSVVADPVSPAATPVQTRSASRVAYPHRELLSDFAPEPGTRRRHT